MLQTLESVTGLLEEHQNKVLTDIKRLSRQSLVWW